MKAGLKGKPLAALIVAKAKPKESDSDIGIDAAFDEVYSTMREGDKEGFRTALKSAIEMCANSDYDD